MVESQSSILGVPLDADEKRNLGIYCKSLIEKHAAEPVQMLRWAAHYATRRKESPKIRPSQAWLDIANASGDKSAAAAIGGEEGRRRRTEGYEDLFDSRKRQQAVEPQEVAESNPDPSPPEPVLLSLVPNDQRSGLVESEVSKILQRRIYDLAREGGSSFETARDELKLSPWLSDEFKETVIRNAEGIALDAELAGGGEARSA